MSRPEARTCAVCGEVSPTTSEHSVHVTLEHPELSRSHRREHGTTAVRPVSCWRCASLLPAGERRCEVCGWEHPGFGEEERLGPVSLSPERLALTEKLLAEATPVLDHRGRPLDNG